MTVGLTWSEEWERRKLLSLQQFVCAAEPPRTAAGRRLPHPEPWAWEVHAYIRQLPQTLPGRPADQDPDLGNRVIMGSRGGRIVTVAHVDFTLDGDILTAFVCVVGVAVDEQRAGVGTACLERVLAEATTRAVGCGSAGVRVVGKIHGQNLASQRMAARFGQEPVGLPEPYQLWVRKVSL